MSQGQRLADRIGVLINGELFQVGDPREVFNLPGSREVAEFVGVENIIDGVITANEEGIATIDIGGTHIEAVDGFGKGKPASHTCFQTVFMRARLSRYAQQTSWLVQQQNIIILMDKLQKGRLRRVIGKIGRWPLWKLNEGMLHHFHHRRDHRLIFCLDLQIAGCASYHNLQHLLIDANNRFNDVF